VENASAAASIMRFRVVEYLAFGSPHFVSPQSNTAECQFNQPTVRDIYRIDFATSESESSRSSDIKSMIDEMHLENSSGFGFSDGPV